MASILGDLQADLFIQLHEEDVAGLTDNGYLRMSLLNLILHLTCTHSHDTNEYNYCIGHTITTQLLQWMLMPISGIKKQEKFMKLCQQLDGLETGKQ